MATSWKKLNTETQTVVQCTHSWCSCTQQQVLVRTGNQCTNETFPKMCKKSTLVQEKKNFVHNYKLPSIQLRLKTYTEKSIG